MWLHRNVAPEMIPSITPITVWPVRLYPISGSRHCRYSLDVFLTNSRPITLKQLHITFGISRSRVAYNSQQHDIDKRQLRLYNDCYIVKVAST